MTAYYIAGYVIAAWFVLCVLFVTLGIWAEVRYARRRARAEKHRARRRGYIT